MMVSDRLLREADPVADWHVDAESSQAQVMLAGILATPRNAEGSGLASQARRGTTWQVWCRRVALGGAAALAAILAVSTPWSGGPNGTAAAYAVTVKPDGSVELTVRWEQLGNVGGLAARLRAAGVPTEVRSGMPARFCAGPADRDRASEALNKLSPAGEPVSRDGYLMQPKLFPEGSILVISTFTDQATDVTYTMLYLAPTGPTACALTYPLGSALYTGPGPQPTIIEWPVPAEPE
jgi:hypothetical protein